MKVQPKSPSANSSKPEVSKLRVSFADMLKVLEYLSILSHYWDGLLATEIY